MSRFTLGVLFLSLSLGWSPLVRADAVTAWNANAGVAATAACIAPLVDPLHESRIYAMMHVAIHDALNAIDRRSRPYAFDMQEPGASPDAAVAAAAEAHNEAPSDDQVAALEECLWRLASATGSQPCRRSVNGKSSL